MLKLFLISYVPIKLLSTRTCLQSQSFDPASFIFSSAHAQQFSLLLPSSSSSRGICGVILVPAASFSPLALCVREKRLRVRVSVQLTPSVDRPQLSPRTPAVSDRKRGAWELFSSHVDSTSKQGSRLFFSVWFRLLHWAFVTLSCFRSENPSTAWASCVGLSWCCLALFLHPQPEGCHVCVCARAAGRFCSVYLQIKRDGHRTLSVC